MTTIRAYTALLETIAPAKIRVYAASLGGAAQVTLLPSATLVEPGETVLVTAENGIAPHTWAISGTSAPTLVPDEAEATFEAPATRDGTTLTVSYNGLYVTIDVLPSMAFVGPTPKPAAVFVRRPDPITLEAPASVTQASATTTTMSVQWAAVPNADTYRIDYKLTADTIWTTLGDVASLSTTLEGLTAATSYDVRVAGIAGAVGPFTTATMSTA